MILKLHIYEDGVKIRIIEIEAEKARLGIGSAQDNEICIKHIVISKKHCEIIVDGELLAVKDLDSIYGTYLNQKLIGQKGNSTGKYAKLESGACLKIAPNYKLYVETVSKKSVKKNCIMCGKEFQTDKALQEFCFDCKLDMELQMGLEKKEEPQFLDTVDWKMTSRVESIKQEALHKTKWEIAVKKPAQGLAEGEILPGYKKIRTLGENPPYIVYLTEEIATKKKYVVKTVTKPTIKQEVFQRAFELQKELERQNVEVVKVHKVGEYNNAPYMIMDYYEAGNVVDFYHKTFPNKKYEGARALLMKMLLSVYHLHNAKLKVNLESGGNIEEADLQGKAHLHLKPGNFLVETGANNSMRILIADFGLLNTQQMTENQMEAFAFVSKEQAMYALDYPEYYGFFEKEYDYDIFYDYYGSLDRSVWDIWAVAAIAYYMLTRHYPKQFDKEKNPEDVVLEEKVMPIWAYDYKVPAEFARIMDLALKDHTLSEEFYFSSAEKLIKALQKIQM